jgi:arabinogalactan oligomer / maltooligosaccharide transport system permease protein
MQRDRDRNIRHRGAAISCIGFLCLVSIIPILFIGSVSFSSGGELYAGNLLPRGFVLDNYRTLFFNTDFLLWVKNSCVVAASTAILATALVPLCAYILSRYRFAGKEFFTSGLLIVQLFPGVMSLAAVYKILQAAHILDTHFALVLVYLGGAMPFAAWMLKGYYDTVSRSIEEAALLDGAGPLRTYLFIVLPLSIPMLVVIFSFTFIAAYSDFILSAVVLTDERLYTLALGLRTFLEGDFSTNWPVFSAAALLGSLPIIGMFAIATAAGKKTL